MSGCSELNNIAGLAIAGHSRDFSCIELPNLKELFVIITEEEKFRIENLIYEIFTEHTNAMVDNYLHDVMELCFACFLRFLPDFLKDFSKDHYYLYEGIFSKMREVSFHRDRCFSLDNPYQ